MKHLLSLLFALLFSYGLSAQTISGTATDAETSEPLGYVSVGIEGTPTGTVADADGKYTLYTQPEHRTDTVCFSLIGYEPVRMPVSALTTMHPADVSLKPAPFMLDELVVKAKKYKLKKFGNSYRGAKFSTASSSGRGFETGPLIEFKKPARLESIGTTVLSCTCDSVLFRINIYKQTDDGRDFVNIQNQHIHAYIYRTEYVKNETTSIEVGVSEYNITVEGNILITFEQLDVFGQSPSKYGWTVSFPVGFVGNRCYARSSSQDTWSTEGAKFPLTVTARVER
jgi:hypothetical protein